MKPDTHSIPRGDSQLDTRQKILAAAREEFAQHGRAGARVDRIARRAGVNKAMLYYHFQSKENLYRQTVGEIISANLGEISKEVAQKTALDELLRSLARRYADLFDNDETMRRMMLHQLANPQPEMFDLIAETVAKSGLPGLIRSALEREAKDGQLRDVDLKHSLASFMALNIGYILVSPIVDRVLQVADKQQFHADRIETAVDLFLNGVKKR